MGNQRKGTSPELGVRKALCPADPEGPSPFLEPSRQTPRPAMGVGRQICQVRKEPGRGAYTFFAAGILGVWPSPRAPAALSSSVPGPLKALSAGMYQVAPCSAISESRSMVLMALLTAGAAAAQLAVAILRARGPDGTLTLPPLSPRGWSSEMLNCCLLQLGSVPGGSPGVDLGQVEGHRRCSPGSEPAPGPACRDGPCPLRLVAVRGRGRRRQDAQAKRGAFLARVPRRPPHGKGSLGEPVTRGLLLALARAGGLSELEDTGSRWRIPVLTSSEANSPTVRGTTVRNLAPPSRDAHEVWLVPQEQLGPFPHDGDT